MTRRGREIQKKCQRMIKDTQWESFFYPKKVPVKEINNLNKIQKELCKLFDSLGA